MADLPETPEPMFPILQPKLDGPREYVPWSLVAPHEDWARRNHFQNLKQLASRGGLSWCELAAVLEHRKVRAMPEDEARAVCEAALRNAMEQSR